MLRVQILGRVATLMALNWFFGVSVLHASCEIDATPAVRHDWPSQFRLVRDRILARPAADGTTVWWVYDKLLKDAEERPTLDWIQSEYGSVGAAILVKKITDGPSLVMRGIDATTLKLLEEKGWQSFVVSQKKSLGTHRPLYPVKTTTLNVSEALAAVKSGALAEPLIHFSAGTPVGGQVTTQSSPVGSGRTRHKDATSEFSSSPVPAKPGGGITGWGYAPFVSGGPAAFEPAESTTMTQMPELPKDAIVVEKGGPTAMAAKRESMPFTDQSRLPELSASARAKTGADARAHNRYQQILDCYISLYRSP